MTGGGSHVSMVIREVTASDIAELAALRERLWPEGSKAEHEAELRAALAKPGHVFLVAEVDASLVGFLEARLRSHADGCETSPVDVASQQAHERIGFSEVDRVVT